MADNPFDDYSLQECRDAIAIIRDRIVNGAQSVSHVGTGSATYRGQADDERNLAFLKAQRDFLLGKTKSNRPVARVKGFVVDHVGYHMGGGLTVDLD